MAGAGDEPADTARPRGHERLSWTLATIFALAALVSTGVAFWLLQPAPAPQEIRLDITTPDAADPYSFALSPDGTKVIYAAGGDKNPLRLWLRSFDSATPTPVAETEGAVHPFWAPDGRSIGFSRQRQAEARRPRRWWHGHARRCACQPRRVLERGRHDSVRAARRRRDLPGVGGQLGSRYRDDAAWRRWTPVSRLASRRQALLLFCPERRSQRSRRVSRHHQSASRETDRRCRWLRCSFDRPHN